MGEAAIAVRCRGLAKHYGSGEGSVPALRGIDLDVRAGELLMLAGPSGCGKTTLLSIIGGILESDSGECEVMGRDLRAMDAEARTRFRGENIGFVFQSFNLLPALSALDNVCVPLLLHGGAYEAARAEGAELSIDDALEWARRARGPRNRPSAGWASLTPTEARVAELGAAGPTHPHIVGGMMC